MIFRYNVKEFSLFSIVDVLQFSTKSDYDSERKWRNEGDI